MLGSSSPVGPKADALQNATILFVAHASGMVCLTVYMVVTFSLVVKRKYYPVKNSKIDTELRLVIERT